MLGKRLYVWVVMAVVASSMIGCGSGHGFVGRWLAVNTSNVPVGLAVMNVKDDGTIDNGNGLTYRYEIVSNQIVRIHFPTGEVFEYGFSRSGESLFLVDAGKTIKYTLDQ